DADDGADGSDEDTDGSDDDGSDDDADGSDADTDTDDPIRIAPVYIRYTKSDVAGQGGSAHVIEEDLLENLEQDDPHTMLLMVPGVYVRNEDAYGLRPNIGIRGAS